MSEPVSERLWKVGEELEAIAKDLKKKGWKAFPRYIHHLADEVKEVAGAIAGAELLEGGNDD